MYKDFKRKLEKKLATAKRSYYNTKFIENRSNSKRYWEIIKELIKGDTKSQNPSHLNDSGTVITDDSDIANRFNDFFLINIGPNLAIQIPQVNTNYQLPGNFPQSFFQVPATNLH